MLRAYDNAELKNKKERFFNCFEEPLPTLGIIRYTAKYEGWLDQLYNRDRYVYRGKFAKTRFERNCL